MFTYQKWDGKSPVGNLKNADEVRRHFKLKESDVAYFIYDDDGNLCYFQYFDKDTGKRLTEDNWEQVAKKHIEDLEKRHQKYKLLQETKTEEVEILVEKRFLEEVRNYYNNLRQNNPIEIVAEEEEHAKELGLNYKIVDTLSTRKPVVTKTEEKTNQTK